MRSRRRNETAAQIPKHEADTAAIEADLATARAEQKRLEKAVAMAHDVPELVVELKKRSARIQQHEGQLNAAKRTPDDLAAIVTRVETNARARPQDLRDAREARTRFDRADVQMTADARRACITELSALGFAISS